MSARKRGRTKRNPGWFCTGHDARRSTYRFTAQDCRIGYLVCAIKHPHLRDWLTMKIRCYYYQKGKTHGQEEDGRGGDPAGTSAGSADIPC